MDKKYNISTRIIMEEILNMEDVIFIKYVPFYEAYIYFYEDKNGRTLNDLVNNYIKSLNDMDPGIQMILDTVNECISSLRNDKIKIMIND